jgi:outer membrane protein, multidrug efflux system
MNRLAALVQALWLAGCSMEPKFVQPDLPVPPSWPVGDAYLAQSEAALPRYAWPDVFADARLRAIIEQALANNQDLARAAANIVAAREQYNITRADLLPRLDGSAGYRRNDGDVGTASLGLSIASYEIDLFGRVRAETNAAQNRYFATESGARAVRLSLIADIAEAWIAHGADSRPGCGWRAGSRRVRTCVRPRSPCARPKPTSPPRRPSSRRIAMRSNCWWARP